MRRLSIALVAAAALAVAGCGGSGKGDKEKIESTVHDYFAAFAASDAAKACDQLTSVAAAKLAKAAHTKDCQAALTVALKRPDIRRYSAQLRQVRVLSVAITGKNAKAKVRAIGASTQVPLRKQGDTWKIEGNPGEG